MLESSQPEILNTDGVKATVKQGEMGEGLCLQEESGSLRTSEF